MIRLCDSLRYARINRSADEWLRITAGATITAAIALFAIGQNAVALPVAALVGVAVLLYPEYQKRAIAGAIERELPMFLRSVASLAGVMPFEEALMRSTGDDPLGRDVRAALRRAALGEPLPRALDWLAGQAASADLARAVEELRSAYLNDTAAAMRTLAAAIAASQKAAMREYSAKLAMYSLVFIAVSAIVPALFLAYLIAGSAFMETGFTASDAFWIPATAMPLADVAALIFIRLKKPFFG